jgi:serine/threonine protein phosphatase PrpC
MDKLLDTEQGQKELQSYATTSKHDINVNAMNVGSTACVCLIDEDNRRMYFANAGDSRVVLCKEGKAFQMSYDHKPNLFLEKNRIYKYI